MSDAPAEFSSEVVFAPEPELVRDRLAKELHRPASALAELVANSLDADASHVSIVVHLNDLQGATEATIEDDGRGISQEVMQATFRSIGRHLTPPTTKREPIGSKGIGRFALFKIANRADWDSVSHSDDGAVRLRWSMDAESPLRTLVAGTNAGNAPTGTVIRLFLSPDQEVQSFFSSEKTIRRELFNSFAAYLARYQDEVQITVNGEPVDLSEYVESLQSEPIGGHDGVPTATLHHMLVGHNVALDPPNQILFATHGATIAKRRLPDRGLPNRKYLGIVDSPYLYQLTNTAKSDVPEFDPGFLALATEASARAGHFIEALGGDRAKAFLERARAEPYYPFKDRPPKTPVDMYTQAVYDSVILAIEEHTRLSEAPSRQQALVFQLTYRLMQNEDDLAAILTQVLGLGEQDVSALADVLRRTSLASVIAVAKLLLDRLEFLREIEELVYGRPSEHVKERSQLHKIVESHTWIFGEEFHLLTSDKSVASLLEKVRSEHGSGISDGEADISSGIHAGLRLVPDLFLTQSRRTDGSGDVQHLIVELKAPSVRVVPGHIDQLHAYAKAIVDHPRFGQEYGSHKFKFVAVSAEISERTRSRYLANSPVGFLGAANYSHPTELWAYRWSDILDARKRELDYLYNNIHVTRDPEALAFLRSRVGALLPDIDEEPADSPN